MEVSSESAELLCAGGFLILFLANVALLSPSNQHSKIAPPLIGIVAFLVSFAGAVALGKGGYLLTRLGAWGALLTLLYLLFSFSTHKFEAANPPRLYERLLLAAKRPGRLLVVGVYAILALSLVFPFYSLYNSQTFPVFAVAAYTFALFAVIAFVGMVRNFATTASLDLKIIFYIMNGSYLALFTVLIWNTSVYSTQQGLPVLYPQLVKGGAAGKGLTTVSNNGLFGFMNNQRRLVVPIRYRQVAHRFSEGLCAAVPLNDRRWGFINTSGEMVIRPAFDKARSFNDGLAAVQRGDNWGFIDKTGTLKIPCKFIDVGNFKNGIAPAATSTIRKGFEIKQTSQNAQPYSNYAPDDKILGPCWGIIDRDGQFIAPPSVFGGQQEFLYSPIHVANEYAIKRDAIIGTSVCELVPVKGGPSYFRQIAVDVVGKNPITSDVFLNEITMSLERIWWPQSLDENAEFSVALPFDSKTGSLDTSRLNPANAFEKNCIRTLAAGLPNCRRTDYTRVINLKVTFRQEAFPK